MPGSQIVSEPTISIGQTFYVSLAELDILSNPIQSGAQLGAHCGNVLETSEQSANSESAPPAPSVIEPPGTVEDLYEPLYDQFENYSCDGHNCVVYDVDSAALPEIPDEGLMEHRQDNTQFPVPHVGSTPTKQILRDRNAPNCGGLLLGSKSKRAITDTSK